VPKDIPPDASRVDLDLVKWTKSVARFTGLLVLATGLLFLANLIASVFIYLQYKVANDTQTDTREQLRAVVTYVGANVIVTNDKDNKPAFYSIFANFHNFGGTRTARFRAWDSIHYFEGNVPNNVDFSKPFSNLDLSDAVIGPNSQYQLSAITISQETAEKAMKKEGSILYWGEAEYSDIFTPTTTHNLAFCLSITPTANTTNGQVALTLNPYRNDCNR
jgi:hypothetical protein